MTDLDDRIAQDRKELECRRPGHAGRAEALANLAYSLSDIFQETDGIADLDEAIALSRQELSLRQADHPDRHQSLHLDGAWASRLGWRHHTGSSCVVHPAPDRSSRSIEFTP